MNTNFKINIDKKLSWWTLSAPTIARELETDTTIGLTNKEAGERLQHFGPNELPVAKSVTAVQLFVRQFKSPLVYILFFAALVAFVMNDLVDAFVILVVVLLNSLIGFAEEYQSNRTLEQLKKIVTVNALVLREGQVRMVLASELVPGDIIVLKTGQKVPADARLFLVQELSTAEAILTGESALVKKQTAEVDVKTVLAECSNMLWMGTVVEEGLGRAVVVATGKNTELGKIANLTAQAENEATPLQERLQALARAISIVVLVVALIILVVGVFSNLGIGESFKTAVAVAVAAIPEGLLAALSVVLAVSTKRILRQHGLVRRPVAAETLGSTTVIVCDKTGTLTEGEMQVSKAFLLGSTKPALLALSLANEAEVAWVDGQNVVHGEATDRAKLAYALQAGISYTELTKDYATVAVLPFDNHLKVMARFVTSRLRPAVTTAYVSGAPEMLLNMCATFGEYEPLGALKVAEMQAQIKQWAADGFRLIGLAERNIDEAFDPEKITTLKSAIYDLNWRGFVVVSDPLRTDVVDTIKQARAAGVRVVMATGDHRLTAINIGQQLGFETQEDLVWDGNYIDELSNEQLQAAVSSVSICYRVTPEHKLRLVQALLANGEAVCMTGDGINDAPALKAADIGVAVAGATDVTKEAADLVLLKNGLGVVVAAVREGRIAFDNIRKVTTYLLSSSFTELVLILASLILGVPLPLTAVMILWANLVQHGLPTFGLAFERGEDNVMSRSPEPRAAAVINGQSRLIIFFVSVIRDFLILGVYLYLYYVTDLSQAYLQTFVFALISVDSLFYVYSIKSFTRPIWQEKFFDNKWLLLTVSISFTLAIMAVYVPFLNTALGTVPLSINTWQIIAVLVLIEIMLYEAIKYWYRRSAH